MERGKVDCFKAYLEIVIVDWKVFFHDCSFLFCGSSGGRYQVLGVIVVVESLEAAGAESCQQDRDDQEISWLDTHIRPELVENFLQCIIHDLEEECPSLGPHLDCVYLCLC